MSKVTFELDAQKIEELIESLPINVKVKLVYKLERETLLQRWDSIIKNIDKRLKKFPISEEEIAKEIEAYRKEKYVKSCR